MGWTFPWASSFGGDFNFDFGVGITEQQQREGGVEYNYRRGSHALPEQPAGRSGGQPAPAISSTEWTEKGSESVRSFAAMAGTDVATYTRERPGMSAFALDDGVVYHTYSTYARGLDVLWGMYQWLDRAPLGRNEPTAWWRRHDEYGAGGKS
jgi:predicted dithiol-disulfide oxidoreductase (DUF899 family)